MASRKLAISVATPRFKLGGVFILFSIFLTYQNVEAGSLDSFEKSVNTENPDVEISPNSPKDSSTCDEGDLDFECIGFYIAEAIFKAMFYGGYSSLSRVNKAVNMPVNLDDADSISKISFREPGSALIPYVRFDTSYHYINSNLDANDYRLALGYGPIAVHYNKIRFSETNPKDSLDISQFFVAYRMSFGSILQMDIGLGKLSVNGNNRTNISYFTLPIRIHDTGLIGFEFKPAWSGNISDHDIGVFYDFKFVSVKAGYRRISTNTESIKGPYVGFSAFY